jgi:putative methyltransferase (TIGR04325 family)
LNRQILPKREKRYFEDERLRFYFSIDECLKENRTIQAILFSSVLQYLENPFSILKNPIENKIPYIIINRTGFTLNDKTRLTVQRVHPKIYKAIYPCWFFGETEFIRFFNEHGYRLFCDFESLDVTNVRAKFKGFVFINNRDA